MPDGKPLKVLWDQAYLKGRPDQFTHCLTEKLSSTHSEEDWFTDQDDLDGS